MDIAVSSIAAIVGGNQFAGLADGSVLIVDKDGRATCMKMKSTVSRSPVLM